MTSEIEIPNECKNCQKSGRDALMCEVLINKFPVSIPLRISHKLRCSNPRHTKVPFHSYVSEKGTANNPETGGIPRVKIMGGRSIFRPPFAEKG